MTKDPNKTIAENTTSDEKPRMTEEEWEEATYEAFIAADDRPSRPWWA